VEAPGVTVATQHIAVATDELHRPPFAPLEQKDHIADGTGLGLPDRGHQGVEHEVALRPTRLPPAVGGVECLRALETPEAGNVAEPVGTKGGDNLVGASIIEGLGVFGDHRTNGLGDTGERLWVHRPFLEQELRRSHFDGSPGVGGQLSGGVSSTATPCAFAWNGPLTAYCTPMSSPTESIDSELEPQSLIDVLVVGAGITGIYQLYRAREAGFSVQLIEAGEGVGGTWFWNRYPGARFDSESYSYGYLFSPELFDEWEWEEHFAAQPETERYLNHVVDRFDLRPHLKLGVRVMSAEYDEPSGTWRITTDDGATTRARFLIAATGVLSIPYLPDVPGRDQFKGQAFHTGQWPASPVDFVGKRVAVIGTSSSGVQVVPVIADQVASLTVYQRTPNWCTPLNNAPITPDEQRALRAGFEELRHTLNTSVHGFHHPANDRKAFDDDAETRQRFYETMWASPGFMKLTSNYIDLLFNHDANAEWCEFVAAKIRDLVEDPDTAARLIPTDHRFGEKRPPFVTGYYQAFNLPQVSLVDVREHPFVRVTANGIETEDGEREFDIIVWATGFDFGTGALARMGIRGRGGLALNEHWADGPTTFLGVQTRGFPNLFFPGGPHAAAGNNPRYNGDQVDFVTDVLVAARTRGSEVIEVTERAEERWTNMVNRGAASSSFTERSYFFGTNIPGKPARYLLNSGGRPKLFSVIAEEKANDYGSFEFLPADLTPSRPE
jgi:cation diffusion facilitator CzcD-associated flavoprotein CzcO